MLSDTSPFHGLLGEAISDGEETLSAMNDRFSFSRGIN